MYYNETIFVLTLESHHQYLTLNLYSFFKARFINVILKYEYFHCCTCIVVYCFDSTLISCLLVSEIMSFKMIY